jgi:thioredoxin-like negative regulator of GroEL
MSLIIHLMKKTSLINQIRDLIANNQLEQALSTIRALLEHSPQLNEAILNMARFQELRQQIRKGAIDHEEATLTKNQITLASLDLLTEIEKQTQKPEIEEEVQRATSIIHNKNVNSGEIKAGGNVHLGDKTINQQADKIYNIDKIDKADFS